MTWGIIWRTSASCLARPSGENGGLAPNSRMMSGTGVSMTPDAPVTRPSTSQIRDQSGKSVRGMELQPVSSTHSRKRASDAVFMVASAPDRLAVRTRGSNVVASIAANAHGVDHDGQLVAWLDQARTPPMTHQMNGASHLDAPLSW